MQIKLNKLNTYTVELKIDIPWITVEPQFNATLKKFSKKFKMPGFRSGKIPRERLLKQFQPNIEADFMESNFQKYYLEALQKEKIVPANIPAVSPYNSFAIAYKNQQVAVDKTI